MSSPAKRRKLNQNVNTGDKPGRSLEHFFKKPQNRSTSPRTSEQRTDKLATSHLTDEQLARKLQNEWDREDGATHAESQVPTQHQHAEDKQDNGRASSEGVKTCTDAPARQAETHVDNQGTVVSAEATLDAKNTLSLQAATAAQDAITNTVPLDQSPLTFEPQQYLPDLQKQWTSEGGDATYALLTHCFVLVNQTQSRIKIVDTLVNLLRIIIQGDPASLLPAVWLATNSISPPYIDMELGLGGSAISKALKKVCGLDNNSLRTLYNKHGDAGDVAFEAKKKQSFTLRKPKSLSIKGVYDSLVKISNSKGQGSQDHKQKIVERLVQDARGAEESRYIVRTLVQHLRIGAVKTTMLIALSRAFLLSRPRGSETHTRDVKQLARLKKEELAEVWSKSEEVVKACFARRPNYNDLVPALLDIGVCDELLIRCGLAMHIPLRPMLGNITRDLGDMLVKLEGREFSCEYKYDGQRAQIHCDSNGKVTIFSRHLEVMTDKYPDLVELVPKIRGDGVSSFILEGEVVAVDQETGNLKAFQTLTNRARKDVQIHEVKVNVCLFSFDLMYLNGEPLLDRSFRERRSLLRSLFTELPGHFTWVKSFDATSNDAEAVSDFFKSATAIKCEGIMVKVLDNALNADVGLEGDAGDRESNSAQPPTPSKASTTSRSKVSQTGVYGQETVSPEVEEKKGGRRKALLSTYEPDKRVDSWLKVKKDYDTTAAETLDLIPIGGWHGQGRKNAWWSPVLLAIRDPETGALQAITKCISGFTDKFYKEMREKYDPESESGNAWWAREEGMKRSYIDYRGTPDVWFEPQEVWEMAFADVTVSPTYTAAIGLVNEERGLSLRFPRFLKVRDDKSMDEATTAHYLALLYRRQEEKAPTQDRLPSEVGAQLNSGDADDLDER